MPAVIAIITVTLITNSDGQGIPASPDNSDMDVRVTWWRRYGQNRLFVEQDGERLGWLDLWNGQTVVERPERCDDVYTALEEYLAHKVPRPSEVADHAGSIPRPSEATDQPVYVPLPH